jgi:hypothetical protein
LVKWFGESNTEVGCTAFVARINYTAVIIDILKPTFAVDY